MTLDSCKISLKLFLRHSLNIELVRGQNKFYAWLNTYIKSNSTYTSFMTCENNRNDILIRIESCSSPLLWFVHIQDLWTFNMKGMWCYYETNTLSKSLYMNKTCVNTQTAQSKCISKYDHVGCWFLKVCKNKWDMQF